MPAWPSLSPPKAGKTASPVSLSSHTTPAKVAKPKDKMCEKEKSKELAKLHRRSRSGCFTCRLRRKKCDEGVNTCRACRNLGLICEYKRPSWWSNADLRRQKKEDIKTIIKQTKTTDKLVQQMAPPLLHHQQRSRGLGSASPPALTHSLPTSATYSVNTCNYPTPVESRVSPKFLASDDHFDFSQPPPAYSSCDLYPQSSPQVLSPSTDLATIYGLTTSYDVDIKTECQTYVDNIPTRKDSATSTFSTCHPPHAVDPFLAHDSWTHDELLDNPVDLLTGADYDVLASAAAFPSVLPSSFSSPGSASSATFKPSSLHELTINVEDADQPLLDHFLQHVLRLTLPVLELTFPGTARAAAVLPALASNQTYLHCCLSVAAIHLRTLQPPGYEALLDQAIVHHRVECISRLCSMLNDEPQQVLEATLAMILFPSAVGTAGLSCSNQTNAMPGDLPEIAWYDHFEAANSLVRRLHLPHALEQESSAGPPSAPFAMSLTAWIDILGATMLGRSPSFADTYREKNEGQVTCGLQDLMGCDDRVMFMISEIACLDALKSSLTIGDLQVCELVKALGMHLDATEIPMQAATATATNLSTLPTTITSIFRLAARIYLCALVPHASPHQPSIRTLADCIASAMADIPAGPQGYDRALVWPLLVGGCMTTATSSLRETISQRTSLLGIEAHSGSWARMLAILGAVWSLQDRHDDMLQSSSMPSRGVTTQVEFGAELVPAKAADGSEVQTNGETFEAVVQDDLHVQAPAESFLVGDVPPWREVMQRRNWQYLLL